MSSPTPKFYFPIAPTEYNQQFMNEVIRSFALFQEQLGNPGKVTAESINLKPAGAEGIKQYSNNREAYDDGLIPGDLWMLSTGEIRVVISPDIDVPVTMPHPQEATGFVGRVTTFDASAEIGDIVNVIEGQVGSVSIEMVYSVSGVVATGELPEIADITIADVDTQFIIDGPEGTGETITVFIESDNNAAVDGLGSTTSVGTISFSLGGAYDVTGVGGTASIGEVTTGLGLGYLTTGLESVSSIGSPSFSGVTGGDFTGFPSGLSGAANIGTVTVATS